MVNLNQIIDQAIDNNVKAQTALAAASVASASADIAVASADAISLDRQLVENKATQIANDRLAVEASAATVAANTAEVQILRDDAVTAKTLAEQYRDDALGFLALTGLKYDHFDDRYMGAKKHDPIRDNDNWLILDGALYWNTTIKGMRVYDLGMGVWRDVSGASGALLLTNNLSDLPDVAAARTNLGVYSKGETDAAIGAVVATKGQPNGIAPLNASGMIDVAYLPSYVDDVIEVATYASLPVTGESDKIYVVVTDETSDNNTSSYRWAGTSYAMVSNTLTGADVAALYESVIGVNRYTDAEKAKLAGIEIGATADQLASEVPYDNTISGMLATNVQEAINELVAGKTDKATTLAGYGITDAYTKIEVDNALALQNQASEIAVTPQGNLSSTTVQLALEELQSDINALNSALGTIGTIEW